MPSKCTDRLVTDQWGSLGNHQSQQRPTTGHRDPDHCLMTGPWTAFAQDAPAYGSEGLGASLSGPVTKLLRRIDALRVCRVVTMEAGELDQLMPLLDLVSGRVQATGSK